MAEIQFEIIKTGYDSNGVKLIKWPGLAQGDTGAPYKRPHQNDRSVHVKGTFGAAGAVVIEGSNELSPASYATLNDPQGNILSISAEKIEAVLENVLNIRPRISGGDVTTSIDVYMLLVGR